MTVVTMRKVLESGVHYGHQTRRWDPKMRSNIYTAKNGIHIINLEKTQAATEECYAQMKALAEKGGKVLFVGTKKQAQAIVVEEALRSGSFYVTTRWLGGTLTNFRTIQKRIKRLVEIEEMQASGLINNYSKKEIALIGKEHDKLENFLGGIKEMKKLPDALFVVDPKEDQNAVMEAHKLNIKVFAVCDTNCDPALVDYAIPGNDDAVRAIKLMTGLMADAIVEAKGGVLEFAYATDDQPEITMADVIVNVDQVNAERERIRRQHFEEKRKYMNEHGGARRPYQSRYGRSNSEAPRGSLADAEQQAKADKPAEAKPVEAKPVEAKPVEEVKNQEA